VHSPNVRLDHNAAEALDFAYRFRQASQVIAFLVATLGLVVFCGWAFHVPALTYIQPTLQSMKVNTALSFLCLGAGLWLAGNDERQRIRRILGLLVVIIAGRRSQNMPSTSVLGLTSYLFVIHALHHFRPIRAEWRLQRRSVFCFWARQLCS